VAVRLTERRQALERLAEKLGHAFRDPELLVRALTHRSAPGASNERLEFLGDGLINCVVGQLLYERHPQAAEGDLTYVRASLVRQESLARLAEGLQLGELLALGSAELKSGVFRRESVLADALEAVLGAVFVDGGFAAARAACERLFGAAVSEAPEAARVKDAKTRLQEHLQGHGRPVPAYDIHAAEGPSHRQSFTVVCRLPDSSDQTEGRGSSRKAAEQEAAQKMLALIAAQDEAHA
jgi:ribonuclease-3